MSPTYIRCEWVHDFEDEPYLLYYELDDERYVTRNIEIFKDDRVIRAGEALERNLTVLSDQPVPTIEEINAQEAFRAQETAAQEFEEAWRAAAGNELGSET
ncbi:MAG: hypothetical protein H0V83_00070 [Rubrobacter sp.]|nr:hypothetical protein [Rubrobacter sp.]